MAVTIAKRPKNPGSTEQVWHIFQDKEYLGYIRKFDDTRTDTSPFQVFDSRQNRERPEIVACFWKDSVNLKAMNPDKHRHGVFVQARQFVMKYFSSHTTAEDKELYGKDAPKIQRDRMLEDRP